MVMGVVVVVVVAVVVRRPIYCGIKRASFLFLGGTKGNLSPLSPICLSVLIWKRMGKDSIKIQRFMTLKSVLILVCQSSKARKRGAARENKEGELKKLPFERSGNASSHFSQ